MSARTPIRPAEAAAAGALLALFAAIAAATLQYKSATFDETAHLPAGVSYWQTGDFRLNPEHPPLVKLWAALPVHLAGLLAVDARGPAWDRAEQWSLGYAALNGADGASRDPRPPLLAARLAMLAWGVALGALVWAWARELWGPRAALVSLALHALSPTMLAHARLVTTDLPAAFAWTLVLYLVARQARSRGSRRAERLAVAALAAAVGLALTVKFSLLLLGPVLLVAAPLARALELRGARPDLRRESLRLLRTAAACALAAVLAIWAVYGFRFSMAAAGERYRPDWSAVGSADSRWDGPDAPAAAGPVRAALDARLLPEGYLYGLAWVLGGAERRLAFLGGETSLTGWKSYFPIAFALKTTPALLAFLAWASISGLVALRRGVRMPPGVAVALVGVAVYGGTSIFAALNIGHRHLAPLYPLLFVLAGCVARCLGGARRWAIAALVAGQALSCALTFPHYLSYFNAFAGGPEGGRRWLLDSNLDWGQDLPSLARWMEREGVERIDLAYFGTASPAAHGIPFRKVALVHDFQPARPATPPRSGELIAVSANLAAGLYLEADLHAANAMLRRGWTTRATILEWTALRDRKSLAGEPHPPLLDWAERRGS